MSLNFLELDAFGGAELSEQLSAVVKLSGRQPSIF